MRATTIRNFVSIPMYFKQYINSDVDLEKNHSVLCPFHDDHNPSMVYQPEKQFIKCWACGAGGDVISLHQINKGFRTRQEAMESLVSLYNIEEMSVSKTVVLEAVEADKDSIMNSITIYKALSLANARKDVDIYCELDSLMSQDLSDYDRTLQLEKFINKYLKR